MVDKRASLEVISPTVEEAISKGLTDLGLPRESVEVEILDEGSRGLFGIGSRQARIRLTIKTMSDSPGITSTTEEQVETENVPAPDVIESEEIISVETTEVGTTFQTEEQDYILSVARETVVELLEKMRVRADVTAEFGQAEDARSRVPIHVDIRGDDLSILIGRRAETLNALQYISSLIVSKEIGRSIPLVVDVEGYRSRRENQLRQLARRMADQAIKTGRRQILEPMPANERRIIHIELRKMPEVTTESIGEEPRRKVTIIPK
jgi:spoIIIJ-associated protein